MLDQIARSSGASRRWPEMGLILPAGPSWAYWSDNLGGTPPSDGTSFGTGVTAGANNADDAAVSAIAALTHDVEYLIVAISGFTSSGFNCSTLLDILIDPAGGTSWAGFIGDLLAGYNSSFDLNGTQGGYLRVYHFPVWVPAGASIGLQARCAHTSTLTGRIVVHAAGGNANPASWWCGQKVESIGIDAANSRGAMHTPGNAGTFSSWTNFGSALSRQGGAVQWAAQGEGDATFVAGSSPYRFEFGIGGSKIGPCSYIGLGSTEIAVALPNGPVFNQLPSGGQLQARATGSSGTSQAIDVAAYVVS